MLIGYARVSTQEQNLDAQEEALKAAGCERIFVEKASGAQRDRPQLRAALDFMRKGDTLVVWKLDRLARTVRQLVNTVEDLADQGKHFKSLTDQQIDTSTNGGLLVFHVFGAIAQFERGLVSERTKAGLAAARSNGKKGGRPPALKPEDIAMAEAMLKDENIPVSQIIDKLGCSESTFFKYFPGGRSAVLESA